MASDQQLLSTCQETREQSIGHNIPEDYKLNQHHWQNLKYPTTLVEKLFSFYFQFVLNDEDTKAFEMFVITSRHGVTSQETWTMIGKFPTYSQDTSLQLANVIGFWLILKCTAKKSCTARLSLLHSFMLATLPAVRWHRRKAEIVHFPHKRCRKTIPGYQRTLCIYQLNAQL
jgi:hypothetical protein